MLDPKVGDIFGFMVVKGFALTFSMQKNGKLDRAGANAEDIVITVWDLDGECVIF